MSEELSVKNPIAEQRSFRVVKANEIIQKAKYDLNITELKALAFIFSKIKPTDTELKEYTISIKDYCMICGIDFKNGGNYKYIKQTIKGLRDKSFWITDENGTDVLIGWLQKARINRGTGKITVKLDEDLQKYVIGLFKNYTQYELLSTLPMKSNYSFRIYELCKSYAFQHKHIFDIDDLKKQLTATNYINFKDFRKYVLEIATREINSYTDLEVSWEPIREGRKTVQVAFYIKQRDSWGRYLTGLKAEEQLDRQYTIYDYLKENENNE